MKVSSNNSSSRLGFFFQLFELVIDLSLVEIVNGQKMLAQRAEGSVDFGADFALNLTGTGIVTLSMGFQSGELKEALTTVLVDEYLLINNFLSN